MKLLLHSLSCSPNSSFANWKGLRPASQTWTVLLGNSYECRENHLNITFKAALINISMLTMAQVIMCNVKEASQHLVTNSFG